MSFIRCLIAYECESRKKEREERKERERERETDRSYSLLALISVILVVRIYPVTAGTCPQKPLQTVLLIQEILATL